MWQVIMPILSSHNSDCYNAMKTYANKLCNTLNYLTTAVIICLILTTHSACAVSLSLDRHNPREVRQNLEPEIGDVASFRARRRSGVLNQHNDPIRLINSAQGMYLEMTEDGVVKGTKNPSSPWTLFKMSSVDIGVVAIQSVHSRRYLAINKKGKITGVKRMNNDCRLLERMPDGRSFTFHREKRRKKFYLSIDKNGRSKRALKLKQPNMAAYFAKKAASDTPHEFPQVIAEKKKRNRRKKGRKRNRKPRRNNN